jgi:hypothetical protein
LDSALSGDSAEASKICIMMIGDPDRGTKPMTVDEFIKSHVHENPRSPGFRLIEV